MNGRNETEDWWGIIEKWQRAPYSFCKIVKTHSGFKKYSSLLQSLPYSLLGLRTATSPAYSTWTSTPWSSCFRRGREFADCFPGPQKTQGTYLIYRSLGEIVIWSLHCGMRPPEIQYFVTLNLSNNKFSSIFYQIKIQKVNNPMD